MVNADCKQSQSKILVNIDCEQSQSKILHTLPDYILMQALTLAIENSPKQSTSMRDPKPRETPTTDLHASATCTLEARMTSRSPLSLSVFISIGY
jgi:hypothetical protein